MPTVNFSFRMPSRFLRSGYGRVSLSVFALALSVGLVCALDLVNRAVLRAFIEIVDTMAGRAALQVTVVEDGGLFDENVAATIASVPGVELAVPVVSATAFTVDGPPEPLTIHAFDLTNDAAVRVYEPGNGPIANVDDPIVFLNQPDSIILVRTFAQRRGLVEGSHIQLDTPTGRRRFTVRALIDPQGVGRAYGGSLLLMDLYAAEEAFTRSGLVNRVDVVVAREANVATVARKISAALPNGLRVETPSQRKADLHAVMRSLQVLLQVLGLIALAAAFMIAFNRLNTVFEQRIWLCGVLRAVGVRRRAVCWMLLEESLLLGAVGSTLGIGLGVCIASLILPVVAATTALNFRLVAPDAELSIRGTSLALAVALGLGAAFFAALLPAWRTSCVSVAETIRGRGTEPPARLRRASWLTCALIAPTIGVCIVMQSVTRDAVWGIVATACSVAATKAISRPFLQFVGIPLTRFLGQGALGVGRFIVLSLGHNPRRNALTIAMVAIGLGTVFWLGIVAYSFETSAVRVFEEAMRADLVVSSAHFGSGSLETPVDDRFGDTIRGVEGVDSVVGIRLANWEFQGGPIVLDAFDPAYFRNSEFGHWPLLGAHSANVWEAVAAGNAVVVSSNFAQNLAVTVGDIIQLNTPTGLIEFAVAGITTDFASPRGTLEMSREAYAQHWNDPKVTRFFIEIARGSDVATVRDKIRDALGGPGWAWRIISSGDLVEYWRVQIQRAFASVYILAGVILVVILFGLADNLTASVTERTWELGVVRALGIRRRFIWIMIVAEALTVTALGLALALAIGIAIGNLWVKATLPHMLGWVIDLYLPRAAIIAVVASTLTSCFVAALIPAYRAAALEPATALRWE